MRATVLRQKMRRLYPQLDNSNSSFAKKARQGMDLALNTTRGDDSPGACKILQQAHDYAATIAANSGVVNAV